MKTQIRKAVFETNSSSSHSLTLSRGDVQLLTLPPDVLKAGKVEIGCGEFGWEWARLYEPISKLTYLVTGATGGDIGSFRSPEDLTESLRETNPKVDQLCRVVEAHTGCQLLLIPDSEGYIDHESVGADFKAYSSDETLRRFIFGPDAFIETGNDNSSAPAFIETDKGSKEDYYEHLKVERPSLRGHAEAKLFIAPYSLLNANGAKLAEGSLLENIRGKGVVVKAVMTVGPKYSFNGNDELGEVQSELREAGLRPSKDLTVKLVRNSSSDPYACEMEVDVLLPKAIAKELGDLA